MYSTEQDFMNLPELTINSSDKVNSIVELINTPDDFQALAFSRYEMIKRAQKFCHTYRNWVRSSRELLIPDFEPLDILGDTRLRLKRYSDYVQGDGSSIPMFGTFPFLNINPSEADLRIVNTEFMPVRATRLWSDFPGTGCCCHANIQSRPDERWYNFKEKMDLLQITTEILFEGFKKYSMKNGICLYFSPNVEKMGRTDLSDKIAYFLSK